MDPLAQETTPPPPSPHSPPSNHKWVCEGFSPLAQQVDGVVRRLNLSSLQKVVHTQNVGVLASPPGGKGEAHLQPRNLFGRTHPMNANREEGVKEAIRSPKRARQISQEELERINALGRVLQVTSLRQLEKQSVATWLVTGGEADELSSALSWRLCEALTSPSNRAKLDSRDLSRMAGLVLDEITELRLGAPNDEELIAALAGNWLTRLYRLSACDTVVPSALITAATPSAKQLVALDLTFRPLVPRPDFTDRRALFPWLWATRNLQELHLTGRGWVTDELMPGILHNNPHLHTLYLGSTGIGDATCDALAQSNRQLQALNLDHTHVTDGHIASLVTGCPLLDDLSLAFTGITDAALKSLGGLEHLKALDLQGAGQVTDAGIVWLVDPKSQLKWIRLPFEDREIEDGGGAMERVSEVTSAGVDHLLTHARELEVLLVGVADRATLDVLVQKLPPTLTSLAITHAPDMTDADVRAILARCPNLRELEVFNALGITPAAFDGEHLGQNLTDLRLEYTGVFDVHRPLMHQLLPNLERLHLFNFED